MKKNTVAPPPSCLLSLPVDPHKNNGSFSADLLLLFMLKVLDLFTKKLFEKEMKRKEKMMICFCLVLIQFFYYYFLLFILKLEEQRRKKKWK